MAHDLTEGRRRVVASVLAQERRGEIHADHAARPGDGVELLVGQVARRGAQRVRVRVRGDDRRVRGAHDVPEPGLVQMRDVDQDAEAVARADEAEPRRGQSRAGVGRGGKPERDALGEGVRPRPDDADRPEPPVVPALEVGEVRGERLGALEVHDRVDAAGQDVVRSADDRHVEALEHGRELVGDASSLVPRDRVRERERVRRRLGLRARPADEEGEEAPGKTRVGGRGEVEMARRLAAPDPEHEIVVTVDDHRRIVRAVVSRSSACRHARCAWSSRRTTTTLRS